MEEALLSNPEYIIIRLEERYMEKRVQEFEEHLIQEVALRMGILAQNVKLISYAFIST